MGKTIKRYYIEIKDQGTILLTKKVYDDLVLHFSSLQDIFALQVDPDTYKIIRKEDIIEFGLDGGGTFSRHRPQ